MSKLMIVLSLLVFTACGKVDIVKGERGDVGAPGAPGQNGQGCMIEPIAASGIPYDPAQYGGALITCANGPQLLTNGNPGVQGVEGQQGIPGTPGQVVQPVQLCPGTPSYPSTFIEVAFCVDSQLWAVYSANGGFMTQLPPGNYSSNGIGSSCSFTVGANCQIGN